ncbi:hypothetical protein DICVIV_06210 [Dictyocaulus viviparus]|uniref:Leishmanolysin-like peptidase n=1 Tax=Dictyocaulus viviparus TaxID=29172 RepID=A0A0D8XZD7_DICVI|nr:hypothetical protein DICVIV_06210 [Dictyocaulus viviparus]
MYIFLVALISHTISSCLSQYIPLSVTVIRPWEESTMRGIIEVSLRSAIRNLSTIISMVDYGIRNITKKSITKCSLSFERSKVVGVLKMAEHERSREIKQHFKNSFLLRTTSFVLLIENKRKLCQQHRQMMASAAPCGILSEQRPLFGIVNICQGKRWEKFHAGMDLFRHELMHALVNSVLITFVTFVDTVVFPNSVQLLSFNLFEEKKVILSSINFHGFGTLLPASNFQKSPAGVQYKWAVTWDGSSKQLATREFLDFATDAVNEAKKHLGCPSLIGIEADSVDKIHLNEYVFGNELMTPILSNVSNRFSYISAAILEETYIGER